MTVFLFRPTFLFTYQLPNHAQIKEELFDHIVTSQREAEPNSSFWNCHCVTTYEDANERLKSEDLLKSVVWDPLDALFEAYLGKFIRASSSSLMNIWCNYYREGFFQEVHHHDTDGHPAVLSGIYLFHLQEPNTTVFHNYDRFQPQTSTLSTETFPEGTILLFPSSLHHEVKPSKAERATIAFNIELL